MTASVPMPGKGNDVAGEEREKFLSVDELREAVRLVQTQQLRALEQEHAEQQAFFEAVTKLSSRQKHILKWIWAETQKQEAYLEANDVDDPEFQKDMDRLRVETGYPDLDEQSSDITKWQAVRDYHRALFFIDSSRGLPWSIQAITGTKPTGSQKSSISRSLKELILRGLVRRSSPNSIYADHITLTPLGRRVSKVLTPSAVTPGLGTK